MIKNVDIRNYIDRVLKKEQRGGVFSGDDFNLMLKMANQEHYDAEKAKAEVTSDITNSLRGFITSVTSTTAQTPATGYYTLPADYGKLLSARRLYGSDYRKADLVTQLEYEERLSNSLTEPSDKYPTVRIEGTRLKFDPVAYKAISVTYLKTPAEPYLDFYWDAYDKDQYMDVGDSYILGADETYLLNGVTKTAGDSITSLTVELDWSEDQDKIAIANRILAKMGISIPNQMAVEFGLGEVNKQEAKL